MENLLSVLWLGSAGVIAIIGIYLIIKANTSDAPLILQNRYNYDTPKWMWEEFDKNARRRNKGRWSVAVATLIFFLPMFFM
jgi:hypothetical protein